MLLKVIPFFVYRLRKSKKRAEVNLINLFNKREKKHAITDGKFKRMLEYSRKITTQHKFIENRKSACATAFSVNSSAIKTRKISRQYLYTNNN